MQTVRGEATTSTSVFSRLPAALTRQPLWGTATRRRGAAWRETRRNESDRPPATQCIYDKAVKRNRRRTVQKNKTQNRFDRSCLPLRSPARILAVGSGIAPTEAFELATTAVRTSPTRPSPCPTRRPTANRRRAAGGMRGSAAPPHSCPRPARPCPPPRTAPSARSCPPPPLLHLPFPSSCTVVRSSAPPCVADRCRMRTLPHHRTQADPRPCARAVSAP